MLFYVNYVIIFLSIVERGHSIVETTFTNVFYEPTQAAAQARLNRLRAIDKYPEIKAYIIQEGENSWRVLRKIRLNLQQPKIPVINPKKPVQKKRLNARKAGR